MKRRDGSNARPARGSKQRPLLAGAVVLGAGLTIGLAGSGLVEAKQRRSGAAPPAAMSTFAARATRPRTEQLQAALDQAARSEPGKVGLMVRALRGDWEAGYRGASLFPQGTLRRLWIGATVLQALERGELTTIEDKQSAALDGGSPVRLKRAEIAQLLTQAVRDDDSAAQDALVNVLGGPRRIDAMIVDEQLAEIVFGPTNAELHKLLWRFARDPAAPGRKGAQSEALRRYLAAPVDAATPDGFARGWAALASGALLSQSSTDSLLQRLPLHRGPDPRVGVPRGWELRILNGTTSSKQGTSYAAASAGLLVDGHGEHSVFVVFASESDDPIAARDRLVRKAVAAITGSSP